MTLVVHTRAQNQWIASWHNVMLLSFSSTALTTNLIDGERVSYKLLEKYPRYATISVVDSNSRVPDADMRRLSSESLTRTARHQVGMATVLEGDGFWLAASRSALAGLLLVVKSPLPHKVFATAAEAAAWMVPQLGVPGANTDDLVRSFGAMRSEQLALAREKSQTV